MRIPKKSLGFTLTEMAIVLGIMGSILSAIWAAAGGVSESNKTNRAQQQIMTIVQNVRSFYSTSRTFPNLSATNPVQTNMNTNWANSGLIPPDMIVSVAAGTLADPWGGTANVYASSSAPDAQTSYPTFEVQYTGIPSAACHQLFATLLPMATSTGLLYIFDLDGWISVTTNPDPSALNCAIAAGNKGVNFSTEWKLIN